MADWSDLQYKWSNMPNVGPQREWASLFSQQSGQGPWGGAPGGDFDPESGTYTEDYNAGGGPQAYTYQGPARGADQTIAGGKYYNPWYGGAYNPAIHGWTRNTSKGANDLRGWSTIPLAPDWFTKMVKGATPQPAIPPAPQKSPFNINQINQDIRQGRSDIIQQGPGTVPAGRTDPWRELMKGGVMAGNPSMNVWNTRPDIGMEAAWQLQQAGTAGLPMFAQNPWIQQARRKRPELFT